MNYFTLKTVDLKLPLPLEIAHGHLNAYKSKDDSNHLEFPDLNFSTPPRRTITITIHNHAPVITPPFYQTTQQPFASNRELYPVIKFFNQRKQPPTHSERAHVATLSLQRIFTYMCHYTPTPIIIKGIAES